MTSIFDRWTDLDPALALRRIEVAYGSGIFDRDSYTDPQRALRQIESAFGIELDDVNGLLDPSTIEAAIDTAIEAGSSSDWVPADAVIYIDLVNDRAWTETDGVVAINTLLGTDANTVNGWGATSYDAGDLTSDGYVVGGPPLQFALIGEALSRVLDGATITVRSKQLTDKTAPQFALLSANGNDAVEFYVGGATNFIADSFGGSLNLNKQDVWNIGSGAISVFAATITATRAEFAVNGCDPQSAVLGADDRPAGNPLVAALIQADTDGAVQSITIYDALPSTTGLSALSETGVTNTAPTSLTGVYQSDVYGGDPDHPDVFTQAQFSSRQNVSVVTVLVSSATDPEGNPLTYSLTDDDDGLWSLDANNVLWTNTTIPSVGDHLFTLRATDPGGLYVEQEFTITVTA